MTEVVQEQDTLQQLMQKEIRLLSRFRGEENRIKQCMYKKDWHNLQSSLKKLQPISEKLGAVDTQRHESFLRLKKLLGAAKKDNFYNVVVRLEEKERDRCAELYRKLKMAVLKVEGVTYGLSTYINIINSSINQVLEEIYPHTKGKIYSKKGMAVHKENPLVVDHQL